MKRAILILLSLTITLTAGWIQIHERSGKDYGSSIATTSDGGFIATGTVRGRNMCEFFVLKVNGSGEIEWERVYGDPDFSDHGNSVQETSDSFFIAVGAKWLPGGHNVWLIKLDNNGDTLWSRDYGWERWDSGNWVEQTSDAGFIITGYSQPVDDTRELWLIKTDSAGELEWDRVYGQSADDVGWCVRETDNGYIVTGYKTIPPQGEYLWLLKTDFQGDTLWSRTYGAGGERGYDIETLSDGGYLIAGTTFSFGSGGSDLWLLRTDSQGDTLWTRTYGHHLNQQGVSLSEAGTDTYVLVGSTQDPTDHDYELWFLKIDAMGDTLWSRTYGGEESDYGHCVKRCGEDGFIIIGETASYSEDGLGDIWIIKTNSAGDTLAIREKIKESYGSWGLGSTVGTSFVFNSYVNRTHLDRLPIFNATGRLVDEVVLDGSGSVSWPETPVTPNGFSPGVYFIRDVQGSQTVRVVLIK